MIKDFIFSTRSVLHQDKKCGSVYLTIIPMEGNAMRVILTIEPEDKGYWAERFEEDPIVAIKEIFEENNRLIWYSSARKEQEAFLAFVNENETAILECILEKRLSALKKQKKEIENKITILTNWLEEIKEEVEAKNDNSNSQGN